MEHYLLVVSVLGNVLIALAYGVIGAWIVPKFDLAASARGINAIKVSGTLFFFCCAVTHSDMAIHDALGLAANPLAPHYLINTLVQALSAPVFAVLVSRSVVVRIIDKDQYESVLDRRILEMERRRDELVAQALAEAGDVTTDVYRALGAPKSAGETGER